MSTRYKRGDVKVCPDQGRVYFHRYRDGKEFWVTQERLEDIRARERKAQRKRYRKNPAKRIAESRAWYFANIERAKEVNAKWRAENHDRLLANNARYRAAKLKATCPSHCSKTEAAMHAARKELNAIHEECGLIFHVDHIVPLSKGGKHHHENLQVVPAPWNLSKNDRSCEVWSEHHDPDLYPLVQQIVTGFIAELV